RSTVRCLPTRRVFVTDCPRAGTPFAVADSRRRMRGTETKRLVRVAGRNGARERLRGKGRRDMAKPVRESSTSVWMDTAEVPRHQALAEDKKADVCVVGAGIAGLTTAYLLAKEGKSVVVL